MGTLRYDIVRNAGALYNLRVLLVLLLESINFVISEKLGILPTWTWPEKLNQKNGASGLYISSFLDKNNFYLNFIQIYFIALKCTIHLQYIYYPAKPGCLPNTTPRDQKHPPNHLIAVEAAADQEHLTVDQKHLTGEEVPAEDAQTTTARDTLRLCAMCKETLLP